jgi:hypothetical protein
VRAATSEAEMTVGIAADVEVPGPVDRPLVAVTLDDPAGAGGDPVLDALHLPGRERRRDQSAQLGVPRGVHRHLEVPVALLRRPAPELQ